eukprot:Skav218599  [mRNA]  locus=scaffold3628:117809:122356:+ [translate_table: standard]
MLAKFDVAGSTGAQLFPDRGNLLAVITARQLGEDCVTLVVDQYAPEGMGLESLPHEIIEIPKDRVLQQQTVRWMPTTGIPPMQQLGWFCNVTEPDTDTNFVFHEDSYWLPLHMDLPLNRPIHHLELFAGGAGGWKSATSFLEHVLGDLQFATVAIEHDADLAAAYALTHDANLVHVSGELPKDLLLTDSNWVLVTDVTHQHWLPEVCKWKVDLCTISAPCPPWSGAADSPGLTHANGMLLMTSILVCRFFRPMMIVLEQVPGFATHDHRVWIERSLHMIGYRVFWQKILNVSAMLKTNRPRWMAVCVRIHGDFQPVHLPSMHLSIPPPADLSVTFPLCALDFTQLALAPATIDMASKPEYMNQRGLLTPHDPDAVLASRIYTPEMICPTFMAKYGTQHLLDDDFLRSHKYYGHFLKDAHLPFGCRHWHPTEIMLKHGATQKFFLWDRKESSWLIVGNMVTPLQSMVPLLIFLNQLRPEQISVEQILQEYQQRRLSASNVTFQRLEGGYFLVPKHDLISEQALSNQQALIHCIRSNDPGDFIWYHRTGFAPSHDDTNVLPDDAASEVSRINTVEPSQQVTPTAPFETIMKGQINSTSGGHIFWFAASIEFSQLSSPWNWKYAIMMNQDAAIGDPSIFLNPSADDHYHDFQDSVVAVILQDKQITLVPLMKQQLVMQHDAISSLSECPHDQFGPLTDNQTPDFEMLILPGPLPLGTCETPLPVLLAAFQNIQLQVCFNPDTDTITVALEGDQVSIITIADFLTDLLPGLTCLELGRTIEQVTNGTSITIRYRPFANHGVCPPRQFCSFMGSQAVKVIMNQCQTQIRSDADLPVRIKWHGRTLWTGFLHGDISAQTLLQLLQLARFIDCGFTNFRLICVGKHVSPESRIRDLPMIDHSEFGQQVVLNVVQQMHGGGPSKQQQRTLQQGALATLFLEQGHDLSWVTQTVDKLISKLSIARVQNTTGLPMGASKIKALYALCDECNIAVPEQSAMTSQAKPMGAPWNPKKKSKQEAPPLDLTQFRIVDNYFRNHDDTPAHQVFDLRPQSTGVFLASPGSALPWIRGGQRISSDELGLLVVGDLPMATDLEHCQIKVPCLNRADQMVLLTCVLVQLGSKPLRCQKSEKAPVDQDDSSLLALTVLKAEWPADAWKDLLHSTNATFRKMLAAEGLDCVTAIWGRSLRAGRAPASPAAAQSIQVHITIPRSKLDSFLSKTGYNKIYATPKLHDGRLDTRFKVIWLSDSSQATVLAAKLGTSMGMVAGKDSVGIRVKEQDFEVAHKAIFPDAPVPSKPSGDQVWKCDGLPFGTTQTTMITWLKTIAWEATPFKPIGPQSWLIRTNASPPQGVVMFNTSPILLRLLPPRQTQKTSVILGPRTDSLPTGDFMQQPMGDPWARYTGPTHASSAPVRHVDGPTQQRLQAQDEKLASLEAEVSKLHTQTQQNHEVVTQQFHTLERHTKEACGQLSSSVSQLRSDFEGAIKESLKLNTQMMDDRMGELRKLILANNKRGKPSKEEDDMSSS